MTINEVPERSTIAEKDKWDLEAIYPSFDEWQTAYEQTTAGVDELVSYSGRLGEGSDVLLDFIRKEEESAMDAQGVADHGKKPVIAGILVHRKPLCLNTRIFAGNSACLRCNLAGAGGAGRKSAMEAGMPMATSKHNKRFFLGQSYKEAHHGYL